MLNFKNGKQKAIKNEVQDCLLHIKTSQLHLHMIRRVAMLPNLSFKWIYNHVGCTQQAL